MDSGGYYVEIACSACGGTIEVDTAGVDVTCPHCGAVLHRRKPRPASASAPSAPASSDAARQTDSQRAPEQHDRHRQLCRPGI